METAGGPANLSLELNEKLKEYFQRNTSLKINNKNPDLFPNLKGKKFEWQSEFFALSVSESILKRVRNYIKNQEAHHSKKSFEDELPEAIWKRKKQGFTFPFEGWLKSNEYIKPSNTAEEGLYKDFQQKKLSWGRYWCALLMNRFQEKM